MISELFSRFFRRRGKAPTAGVRPLAARIDGKLPGTLPEGLVVCVLQGKTLTNVCRDEPPGSVAAGEICWLVPTDDIALPVRIEIGEEFLAADVAVRLETDPSIASLLHNRTEVTRNELLALVTSELAGLVDLLGFETAEAAVAQDGEGLERLRAKLSLLLQSNGLRCTGVAALRVVKPEEVEEEIAQAIILEDEPTEEPANDVTRVMAAADGGPPQPAEPVTAEQLEPALAKAVGQVKTDDAWEDLLGQLETGGLPVDGQSAAELDDLGQQVLDGTVRSGDVAARIRGMAEAARHRAGVPTPDLSRWQGLALRMQLADTTPESIDDSQPPSEGVAGFGRKEARLRRPRTWWILRRKKVDDRLRGFLKESVGTVSTTLGSYRRGLKEVRPAARVRELDQQISLIADLLATVPTLTPRLKKLRLDRRQVKELVRNVERAVTAAEMMQAQARHLVATPPGTDAWDQALAETRIALDTLEQHLRARRAVR
ncbi:MAG: hypothetical protein HQ581_10940 [Planctomycetes bacterium]|nr:hypothetical protein [Planctomycetota bacterium]